MADSFPQKLFALCLLVQVSFSLSSTSQSGVLRIPPQVRTVISELPQCSFLRLELERGVYGDGMDRSYMRKMREQGIQRASIEVGAAVHKGKADKIHIVQHSYFRQLDGPESPVIDETILKSIEASGLQAELDDIARSRVLAAPVFIGHGGSPSLNKVYGHVQLFATPWVREPKTMLFQLRVTKKPLNDAVVHGDVARVEALLRSQHYTKPELNQALLAAALGRYDNSPMIKLLLSGGADVNAQNREGTTPLMNAVAHPCNLRPLLAGGADPSIRDKSGRTALQLARETRNDAAIRLLE